MLKATTPDTATIWAKAILSLPQEQMKFALNAAVDTLLSQFKPPHVEGEGD